VGCSSSHDGEGSGWWSWLMVFQWLGRIDKVGVSGLGGWGETSMCLGKEGGCFGGSYGGTINWISCEGLVGGTRWGLWEVEVLWTRTSPDEGGMCVDGHGYLTRGSTWRGEGLWHGCRTWRGGAWGTLKWRQRGSGCGTAKDLGRGLRRFCGIIEMRVEQKQRKKQQRGVLGGGEVPGCDGSETQGGWLGQESPRVVAYAEAARAKYRWTVLKIFFNGYLRNRLIIFINFFHFLKLSFYLI